MFAVVDVAAAAVVALVADAAFGAGTIVAADLVHWILPSA